MPTTKRKRKDIHEVGHRVTLFKGEHSLNGTAFKFLIFVEGPTYSIIGEQTNAAVQEQINIPYQDYKVLYA